MELSGYREGPIEPPPPSPEPGSKVRARPAQPGSRLCRWALEQESVVEGREDKRALDTRRDYGKSSKVVWNEVEDIIMRPSSATGCFYHRSNCFGYFQKLRSWSDAELEVQSYGKGAHLASILIKEASIIAEYISGYQTSQPVWIGLQDPQKRQQWQWIDGALLYRTWSGKSMCWNKHYAEMSSSHNFLPWNNNECNKCQHFLCKHRP
ncbi:LOW QUALITY PROTEIN: regenerating islet-derived protein 4 [Trichechus inunguis]